MLGEEQMQTDPVGPSILGERVAETARAGGPGPHDGEQDNRESAEVCETGDRQAEADDELPDDEDVKTDIFAELYARLRNEIRSEHADNIDLDEMENSLNLVGKSLDKWERNDYCYKHQSKLINSCLQVIEVVRTIKTQLSESQLSEFEYLDIYRDFDGFLSEETLRSINASMLDSALTAYARELRSPPNVTAIIFAGIGRGVRDLQPVNDALRVNFVGNAVEDLDATLHQVYSKRSKGTTAQRLYAPVVALLQSSGSGKTRTAMQLSTKQIGLYLCVRHPPPPGCLVSAPPQDTWAYDCLVPRLPAEEKQIDATINVGSWLWAFATEYKTWLETQRNELSAEHQSGESGEIDWPMLTRNAAATLLDDIVPGFRIGESASSTRSSPAGRHSPLAGAPASPNNTRLSVRATLLKGIKVCADKKRLEYHELARSHENKPDSAAASGDPYSYILSQLTEAFKALQDLIPDGHYCFLAIDEAASMGSLRLTELRRCLSHQVFPKFRVLLLDTSNKITELTGMNIDHRDSGESVGNTNVPQSYRISTGSLELAPPFTRFPLNVNLWGNEEKASRYRSIVTGGVKASFEDVHSFLPLMGRPLLNDRYWREEPGLGSLYNKLVASTKAHTALTAPVLTDLKNTDVMSRAIAAACQRLPLDLIGVRGEFSFRNIVCDRALTLVLVTGAQAPSSFLLKQVSLHMRTVLHVAMSGAEISSHTPSEPLLRYAVLRGNIISFGRKLIAFCLAGF